MKMRQHARVYLLFTILATAILVSAIGSVSAYGGYNRNAKFSAVLDGYKVVTPISTTGTGTFTAELTNGGTKLNYKLTYSGLEGGDAILAHINFGQKGVNGGMLAMLCSDFDESVPLCPSSGTVTGTLTASSIVSLSGNGIDAGEFDEFVKALQSGATYVNVRSEGYGSGEIRGQISSNNSHDEEHEHDDE